MVDVTKGTICRTTNGGFLWEIPNFLECLADETIKWIGSPFFDISGWKLGLYVSPRRMRAGKPLAIFLSTYGQKLRRNRYTVGIQRLDNTVVNTVTGKREFYDLSLKLSYLSQHRSELVPSGNIRIVLIPNPDWGTKVASVSTLKCELNVPHPADNLPVSLELSGLDKLSQDLKVMLENGESNDVTIRVRGVDFPAHRIILGARTPVFSAMFRHDTTERASGIVTIEDCDPETFRNFLLYVYTGRVEKLTLESAAELYDVADKYQVGDLKETCLRCMKSELSVETFCHVITMALKHDEKELIRQATDFFASHMREILPTPKWITFLSENPIQGNELVMKAVETDI